MLLDFFPRRLLFVITCVPIVVSNFAPTFVPRRLLFAPAFVPGFVPAAANQQASPPSLVSSAMTSVVQVKYIFMDRARDCTSQPAHPTGLGLKSGSSNSLHWNPCGILAESLVVSSASQSQPVRQPGGHPEFRKDCE